MSNDFIFEDVCSGTSPLLDVIFVHGLTGDARDTWSNGDDDGFWPRWLNDDLEHLSVYTLGYPASLFEKWAKKEMDLFERAGNVLEYLAAKGVGERPIVFVTHSLGGILTKILIRKSNESEEDDYKKVSEVTKSVIFLSTPHNGAALANMLQVVPKSSPHITLLADNTGFLQDLNQQYRTYANNRSDFSTKVYYEKHATKKTVIVVSRESADPGVSGTQPIAIDKDHINICKPADKDDIVYLGVKRHISNLLKGIIESSPSGKIDFMGVDCLKKSEDDRRDLLQKLIDANKEHEYGYANSAQNEFARNFSKTGLFTNAREDHEILLSEVETRFISHVFHPLICKGAEDEYVREAIQKHIIDPISEKKLGSTRFSARSILSALYFLTEQCRIKWDYAS